MNISLRQLEVFCKVAEYQSFSKAGEDLHLGQSTVSIHISQLEQILQTTLLVRTEKKNIVLTESGQQVLKMAKAIVSQATGLECMFSAGRPESTAIAIAASTIPSAYLLPSIMAEFSDQNPETRFSVLEGDSSFAIDCLQRGESRFAFVGTSVKKGAFTYLPICRDKIVLVTPNTEEYRNLKGQGVLGRDLLDRPVIMREFGSGTRNEIDHYLKSIGRDPQSLDVLCYMNNYEGIKKLVASGKGVAMLSERAVEDSVKDGSLLCFDLETDGPWRNIYLAYMRNAILTHSEQAFLNFVKRNWRIED